MTDSFEDHYKSLGLLEGLYDIDDPIILETQIQTVETSSIVDKEISKAFRKKALEYHPDRLIGLSEEEQQKATLSFDKIRRAIDILSNKERLEEYNKTYLNLANKRVNDLKKSKDRRQAVELLKSAERRSLIDNINYKRSNDSNVLKSRQQRLLSVQSINRKDAESFLNQQKAAMQASAMKAKHNQVQDNQKIHLGIDTVDVNDQDLASYEKETIVRLQLAVAIDPN